MRKTYITALPNQVGAFLRAGKLLAEIGLNITRASYNKAIDSHTLFIEVEGSETQLAEADNKLREIGYIRSGESDGGVTLVEFKLKDKPGTVALILELISNFGLNISYISSQEDGSEFQHFKIGLLTETKSILDDFLSEASKICEAKIIDYNRIEKNFDNSFFYNSFITELSRSMELGDKAKDQLAVYANLTMQQLDELGLSPFRTFDSIGKCGELLSAHRGNAFAPRISQYSITANTEITVIEPPCGSNTMIIKSMGKYLFIDCGYACYRNEMIHLLKKMIPNFDDIQKEILITHADVDHCGLLDIFHKVYASAKSKECLSMEYSGGNGFREQNRSHKPYIQICKILTSYAPPDPEKIEVIGHEAEPGSLLSQIATFSFGELNFEVLEGKGGHLPGEIILIDYEHKIAFTGDIYINLKALTAEQREYNQFAPTLMTSVDTDPQLAAGERRMFLDRLGAGKWQIFGSHGMKKDYNVTAQ